MWRCYKQRFPFGAQRPYYLMAISESAANLVHFIISFFWNTHTYNIRFFGKIGCLNSHSLKPMLYKIKINLRFVLLWVLTVSFGASASWFGANLPILFKTRVLAIQGAIGVAFLAFIIFTSTTREVEIPPFDGQDLNPLQDRNDTLFYVWLYRFIWLFFCSRCTN